MNVRRGFNGWRGLTLVVFVLAVHLWLLHAADIPFDSATDTAPTELKFLTRTLDAPTPLAPAPATTTTKRRRPRQLSTPKTNPQTKPEPVLQPEAERQPQSPPESLAGEVPVTSSPPVSQTELPTEAADATTADEDPATAQDASQATAPGQSASEVSDAEVPSAPNEAELAVPRPPRERPLNISADALTGSTRLVYVVNTSKFPYLLSSELLWRNNGDSYSVRLRFSAFWQARVQTSRGRIGASGLAPERFSDKYRSEVAAHFNYTQGKVTFSANTPDAALLAGAQDRLSVLIQLGAILGSEPERFAPGVTLTIPTVGPRAAELWLFEVVGTEALTLPGGAIDAVKLERLPRGPYDQKVELWLSPSLGYLPARIRITESNGNSIDQQWQATEAVDDVE